MTMTADDRAVSPPRPHRPADRSPRRNPLIWPLRVLALLAVGAGSYGAYTYLFGHGDGGGGAARVMTTPVQKADLLITVTEDGNVESANNVELKCMVPGPITILEIVPDGNHVKKGDLLVRLDSSSIEDSVLAQEIAVAKAEAAKISSEKDFAAAKIAVDEYEQGSFRRDMRRAEADIVIAKQNLSTAENQLNYSRKMHRKGYVTQLDVESKEFALEQAKLDVEVAELTREVLEKFTKAKTLEELRSKRDSAQALMNSEVAAFTKESNQLKRLQDQLAQCTVTAPADGMVVYANDKTNPWQQGPKVDLGAQVNQFQAVVRLPDLKNIQVRALVHETKVDQLRPGMRSRIKIQDREFQGEITSISNQPEAANWLQGNVKEYATLIKIDGEPDDLKPGMTAELEILVSQKKDVLQVPVQCVVERGGKFRAYVKTHAGIEARDLVLGGTNDTVLEIVDGLKEGEQVLLNPRADVPETTAKLAETTTVDVDKRYGATRPKPAAAPSGTPAPSGGAGPASGGTASGGTAGFKLPTFKDLDKDKDGKLSREEYPEQGRQWFDLIDTSHDGSVDSKEFKAAMDQAKKMMNSMGGGTPSGQAAPAPSGR